MTAGLAPLCESCGKPLVRSEMVPILKPAYARERKARQDRFKTMK